MTDELPSWVMPPWNALVHELVPKEGQSTTVQGELLRVSIRIGSEMGNNGLGNWLNNARTTATYEAFADTLQKHLSDGTFNPETTETIMQTINNVRAYGRREIDTGMLDDRDVDDLSGYAILWVQKHPEPVPREFDERMAF